MEISGIFSYFTRYLKKNIPLLTGIFTDNLEIENIKLLENSIEIKTIQKHELKEKEELVLTGIVSGITVSHFKKYKNNYIVITEQSNDITPGLKIETFDKKTFKVNEKSPDISFLKIEVLENRIKINLENPSIFKKDMEIFILGRQIEFKNYSFRILEVNEDCIILENPFTNLKNIYKEGYININPSDKILFLESDLNYEEEGLPIIKQKMSLYYNDYYLVEKVIDEKTFLISFKKNNMGLPYLTPVSFVRKQIRIFLDSTIENFIKTTEIIGDGKARCKLAICPEEGNTSFDRGNDNDAVAVSFDGGSQYLTYIKNLTCYLIMEKQKNKDFSIEINIASNFIKLLNNFVLNYKFLPLVQNNTTSGLIFTGEGEYIDTEYKKEFGNSLYTHSYTYQYTEQILLENTTEQIDFDKVYEVNNEYLTLKNIFDNLKLDVDNTEFLDPMTADSRKNYSTYKIRKITNKQEVLNES